MTAGLDYIDMTLMHFPIGQTGLKSSYDYVAVSPPSPSFPQAKSLMNVVARPGKKWKNTPAKEN
jgi:hypothetical protein